MKQLERENDKKLEKAQNEEGGAKWKSKMSKKRRQKIEKIEKDDKLSQKEKEKLIKGIMESNKEEENNNNNKRVKRS